MLQRLLCVLGKLNGSSELQLHFDPRSVGLDGLDVQAQCGGNLSTASPLADQFKNFQFSITQLLKLRARRNRWTPEKAPNRVCSHSLTQVKLAIKHESNCLEQFFGGSMLAGETCGASPNGTFGVERFIIHRKDQH